MEDVETVQDDIASADDQEEIERLQRIVNESQRDQAEYQLPSDGCGPVYRRSYWVSFCCELSPQKLVHNIKSYPERFCDPRLAKFTKTRGTVGRMEVGDRFHIHISGPWDGPVEVIETDDDSFTFVTLADHLEAGFIRFSIQSVGDLTEFRIDSWASSAGPLVWLTYSGLGITKKMQTKMWRHYCLKVVEVVSGKVVGPLRISTVCLTKEGKHGEADG